MSQSAFRVDDLLAEGEGLYALGAGMRAGRAGRATTGGYGLTWTWEPAPHIGRGRGVLRWEAVRRERVGVELRLHGGGTCVETSARRAALRHLAAALARLGEACDFAAAACRRAATRSGAV